MISITLFMRGGRVAGFESSGHAGYDEHGSDIVCSAVSALTVTAVISVEKFTQDAMQVEEREEDGYLKCLVTESISPETALLLDSLVLGLEAIEETYGHEYLTITRSEES